MESGTGLVNSEIARLYPMPPETTNKNTLYCTHTFVLSQSVISSRQPLSYKKGLCIRVVCDSQRSYFKASYSNVFRSDGVLHDTFKGIEPFRESSFHTFKSFEQHRDVWCYDVNRDSEAV